MYVTEKKQLKDQAASNLNIKYLFERKKGQMEKELSERQKEKQK